MNEILAGGNYQNTLLCSYPGAYNEKMKMILDLFSLFSFCRFVQLRRNTFLRPCNGSHDQFYIFILFSEENITVFRRDG